MIDLCAAPGGKTLLLAEEMQGRAHCTAAMWQSTGSGSSGALWNGMGFAHVTALCNDATRPNPKLPAADRILVDAPCSGLAFWQKSRISAIRRWKKHATMNYWLPSRPFWTQQLLC